MASFLSLLFLANRERHRIILYLIVSHCCHATVQAHSLQFLFLVHGHNHPIFWCGKYLQNRVTGLPILM